jgi:predicted hydrocarbon binding protein
MGSFFTMPGSALLDLREELELLEGERAADTMERFGRRAGRGLVRGLDLKVEETDFLGDLLNQLWLESGLSRMRIKKLSRDEMIFAFQESIEAVNGRRCDFSRGYISGILSELLGKRFVAREEECISEGARECVHVLTSSEEQKALPVENVDLPADMTWGNSYLLETEGPEAAYERFAKLLRGGARGMAIVREYPEKLRATYDLEGARFIWLSFNREIEYATEPTNIPYIFNEVKTFLEEGENGVLLISGLEYMVSQSNYSQVLKFIQILNENVAVLGSMLIVPLSTGALEAKEVKLLERELVKLEMPQDGEA